MSEPRRGEVWWGEAPDRKGRPYVVMTRDEAIPVRNTVLVAPVTRTVRGIPTELALGPAEGLSTDCVASMDAILSFPKSMLTRRMGGLPPGRWHELCDAAQAAIAC